MRGEGLFLDRDKYVASLVYRIDKGVSQNSNSQIGVWEAVMVKTSRVKTRHV